MISTGRFKAIDALRRRAKFESSLEALTEAQLPAAPDEHDEAEEPIQVLGGLLILETRDLNHAIQLISNHPGIKMGRWEIRPAQDLKPMIEESERRRSVAK
ncbi:MAG: YciI family protein [Holophaga sp.]|nr:YciI family protein [Holophaga sp.]